MALDLSLVCLTHDLSLTCTAHPHVLKICQKVNTRNILRERKMGIDHFLRQLRDGELESESSEEEPEVEEEPQGKIFYPIW